MPTISCLADAIAETQRLSAHAHAGIFDVSEEHEFEAFARLAAVVTGTSRAAISVLEDKGQRFKASYAVAFEDVPREMASCAHSLATGPTTFVQDAKRDPRFHDHPHVTCDGGIRFYGGACLLLASGQCIGSLCVFDPEPRDSLLAWQVAAFRHLAGTIAWSIEARRTRRMGEIAAKVVEATSDAVVSIDDDGLITVWNRAAEQMFGIATGEAIGKALNLVLAPANPLNLHFEQIALGAAGEWVGTPIELTACHADGSEFPIELLLTRWGEASKESGFAAILRDISTRKALERERQHAQDFLDTVIANLPAMVSVSDARTKEYMLINTAGASFFGRPASEMIGYSDRDLFPAQGHAIERRDDIAIAATSATLTENAFLRDDGTTGHIRTTRLVIDGLERPNQYILRLGEDVTQATLANATARRLARFDALTGLINRSFAIERMDRLVAAGASFALLRIDLNHFKAINNQFGPRIGDEVLSQAAARLRAIAGPADNVARIGGDEFAIHLISDQPAHRAHAISNAIIDSLAKPFFTEKGAVYGSASIGIVVAPADGNNAEHLRQSANLAIHRAKQQGRGSICTFNADMGAAERDRRMIERDLRDAIHAGQITLAYQPILSVATGQVSSVEALARWTHPVRGPIAPDMFIGLAEECGLIGELGEFVLRRACEDAAAWPDNIRIAVNLSPLQFESGNLCALVSDVLRVSGLAANRLQLEVTEGLLIRDTELTFAQLGRLRALGIQILMDDFGVGYSSLSYFERFPFDKVKIDKSFVNGLTTSRTAKAIIKSVIDLGEQIGMGVVAEGVETDLQKDSLIALGCTHLQGYLFSKPVAAAAIGSMVKCGSASIPMSNPFKAGAATSRRRPPRVEAATQMRVA